MTTKSLTGLLGQLRWLGRPNARVGAFMEGGGAYKCLQQGQGRFPRVVANGLAAVLLF